MTSSPAAGAGIGLRSPHVAQIMASRPPLPWLEIHAENYMGGGPRLPQLDSIRRDYPVSIHGVGLSIGSAGPLDTRHLARLRALIDRVDPCLVSEHLAWSVAGSTYLNHLLPLPYTEETLGVVADRVRQAQDVLGRRLLMENPSSYLRFRHSPIPETEFLAELSRTTGCGLLCDVNNIYVSACNLGFDATGYLDALPRDGTVGEIHLAGHSRNDADGVTVLIDDHGSRVDGAVWDLYRAALARFGRVPTLIEWDTDVPDLSLLVEEATIASTMMRQASADGDDARAA